MTGTCKEIFWEVREDRGMWKPGPGSLNDHQITGFILILH